MGSDKEEDDGEPTPAQDDDDAQCPAGPLESVFAFVY